MPESARFSLVAPTTQQISRRINLRLFGRDLTFYTLLESQAGKAHQAALVFHSLSKDFSRLQEYVDRIAEIEHEADEVTHQLANKTDATFVTPLDKEDLHALSSGLDDITDFIEAATGRIALYRLAEPRPDLEPLVALLVEITKVTAEAIGQLRHGRPREAMHGVFVRIHEIENESDDRFRKALADLFNAPNPDVLMVIKWKEIYDRVEIAVDKCEDVANVIESVVVKYA
jgi:predicted phosphate transport protein (TIGR00153 family)